MPQVAYIRDSLHQQQTAISDPVASTLLPVTPDGEAHCGGSTTFIGGGPGCTMLSLSGIFTPETSSTAQVMTREEWWNLLKHVIVVSISYVLMTRCIIIQYKHTHIHTHTHPMSCINPCTHRHTPLATSTNSTSLCPGACPLVLSSARWKDFRPCSPVRRRASRSLWGRSEQERSCNLANSSGVRILSTFNSWATSGMSTIWSDDFSLLTMWPHWANVRLSYCFRAAAEERDGIAHTALDLLHAHATTT